MSVSLKDIYKLVCIKTVTQFVFKRYNYILHLHLNWINYLHEFNYMNYILKIDDEFVDATQHFLEWKNGLKAKIEKRRNLRSLAWWDWLDIG